MWGPPPKGSTLLQMAKRHEGFEDYTVLNNQTGEMVFYHVPKTPTESIGASGKSPNPSVPQKKPVGWKPCKNYRRYGSRYTATGFVYGERDRGGGLFEKVWRTVPIGTSPQTTYHWSGVNEPFSVNGEHPWMDANTQNRLITEALIKLQDRKVNYGEALAESRKTINHLAQTAKRLAWIFLGVKRGNRKLLAKGLGLDRGIKGAISNSWLEYQYGWLPLMSDAYATMNLLKEGFGAKPQLMRVVRNLSSGFPVDLKIENGPTTIRANGAVAIQDRCILFYKVSESELAKYGQLGLINPLEVAWAVVPYSFVIDWFVPIGNFLQATLATVGTTFIDGCLSRSADGLRTVKIEACNIRYPYISGKSTYSCTSAHRSFDRVRITSAPSARPYYKSPFSTTHAASALALLAQLRR